MLPTAKTRSSRTTTRRIDKEMEDVPLAVVKLETVLPTTITRRRPWPPL
jgi:hypothetical protein